MEKHNARGCGLPQRLLLPKGKSDGMDFELFVSVTSGDDAVDQSATGGFGYCGIKGQAYPDKRAMGYPLDRHVDDDRFFKQTNIKWVTVKIFHHDED